MNISILTMVGKQKYKFSYIFLCEKATRAGWLRFGGLVGEL